MLPCGGYSKDDELSLPALWSLIDHGKAAACDSDDELRSRRSKTVTLKSLHRATSDGNTTPDRKRHTIASSSLLASNDDTSFGLTPSGMVREQARALPFRARVVRCSHKLSLAPDDEVVFLASHSEEKIHLTHCVSGTDVYEEADYADRRLEILPKTGSQDDKLFPTLGKAMEHLQPMPSFLRARSGYGLEGDLAVDNGDILDVGDAEIVQNKDGECCLRTCRATNWPERSAVSETNPLLLVPLDARINVTPNIDEDGFLLQDLLQMEKDGKINWPVRVRLFEVDGPARTSGRKFSIHGKVKHRSLVMSCSQGIVKVYVDTNRGDLAIALVDQVKSPPLTRPTTVTATATTARDSVSQPLTAALVDVVKLVDTKRLPTIGRKLVTLKYKGRSAVRGRRATSKGSPPPPPLPPKGERVSERSLPPPARPARPATANTISQRSLGNGEPHPSFPDEERTRSRSLQEADLDAYCLIRSNISRTVDVIPRTANVNSQLSPHLGFRPHQAGTDAGNIEMAKGLTTRLFRRGTPSPGRTRKISRDAVTPSSVQGAGAGGLVGHSTPDPRPNRKSHTLPLGSESIFAAAETIFDSAAPSDFSSRPRMEPPEGHGPALTSSKDKDDDNVSSASTDSYDPYDTIAAWSDEEDGDNNDPFTTHFKKLREERRSGRFQRQASGPGPQNILSPLAVEVEQWRYRYGQLEEEMKALKEECVELRNRTIPRRKENNDVLQLAEADDRTASQVHLPSDPTARRRPIPSVSVTDDEDLFPPPPVPDENGMDHTNGHDSPVSGTGSWTLMSAPSYRRRDSTSSNATYMSMRPQSEFVSMDERGVELMMQLEAEKDRVQDLTRMVLSKDEEIEGLKRMCIALGQTTRES